MMNVILVLFLIGLIIGFYFLPTIIASARKHHNRVPILLVNLFAGWTFVGWLIALVWAFTSPPVQVIRHEHR
jgi:hypothetical protein